jgi:hypothetical protein
MEPAMLRNRTFLLACIPVAMLALVGAGSTTAEARACFFKSMSKASKSYSQASNYKTATAKPAKGYAAAKPAKAYAAAKPAKAYAAKPKNNQTSTKNASSYAPAAKQIKPARPASPVVPPTAEAATSTCLVKEYLETGAVQFKDICTNEWAINATHLSKPVAGTPARSCLMKDNHQDGVVMFKDVCTNEWAMNTAAQQQAQSQ